MADELTKTILKAGKTYSICTCGNSKCIPFCDDSHRKINEERGTSYKALKILSQTDTEIYINSKNWNKIEK